jgi:hypothetical protein
MMDNSIVASGKTLFGDDQTLFGKRVLQSYEGLVLYERLLTANCSKINWVVEIGTATGALSLYFAVWCRLNNVRFTTIDNGRSKKKYPLDYEVVTTIKRLRGRILRGDCFKDSYKSMLVNRMSDSPGFLFCDGGDKPRELSTFAPCTHPGSIIAVHDWTADITKDHVNSVPEVSYLQPWHDQSVSTKSLAVILVRNHE